MTTRMRTTTTATATSVGPLGFLRLRRWHHSSHPLLESLLESLLLVPASSRLVEVPLNLIRRAAAAAVGYVT